MATSNIIYLIDNTDGTLTFAIQPRTVDGPGGVQQNTDLTLYGNGAPSWGERFNENFYHLTENFATDEQSPGVPKNAANLGDLSGTVGINEPLKGQTWYNKTTDQLFMYDGTTWRNVADIISHGGTNLTTGIVGQLYYNELTERIEVWNGLSWIDPIDVGGFVQKTGDTMTGPLTLDGGVPTGDQAVSFDFVDGEYVSLTGDIMSGALLIDATTDGNGSSLIPYTTSSSNPTGIGPAIHQHMVDSLNVPYTNVTNVLYQPVYETYTPKNDGTLTGAAATDSKPVFRLSSPPGYAFALQLDDTFRGGTDVVVPATIDDLMWAPNGDVYSGLLVWNGTELADVNWGTIHCPNALLANINAAGPDVLTTKEYVDNAVSGAVNANPHFINPVTYRSSGGTKGWTTVNANTLTGGAIPTNATGIIHQYRYWLNQPDGGDVICDVYIRQQSGGAAYRLCRSNSSGDGDANADAGQGVYPCVNGTFQYTIETPGIQSFRADVIGYYGPT